MSIPLAINTAWWASTVPSAALFALALARPADAQRAVLRRILRANAVSAFGREHAFDSISTIEEFRSRVPVREYEEFRPYIDRIRSGESAVLTCEQPMALLPTSGSTSAFKLIPFTQALKAEMGRAIGPWVCGMFSSMPGLAAGRAYWSISPSIRLELESAVPIGFGEDSEYLAPAIARLVERTFAVPSKVAGIRDVHDFRYVTLLHLLLAVDLRFISVWHPTFFVLMLERLPDLLESLIHDIREGRCTLPSGACGAEYAAPAAPGRAAYLEQCGPDAAAVWPRLQAVSAWTEGHASISAEALRRALPQATLLPKGLIATEGIVSIPWGRARVLSVRSHFFEFLSAEGRMLTAEELVEGEVYTVTITTGGGLYRYRLGDRVRVGGHVDNTPTIEFVAREGGGSDLRGEKLSPEFVEWAVGRLVKDLGISPSLTVMSPVRGDPPSYRLLLGTSSCLPPSAAATLDNMLRENPHYDLCRRLGQLKCASVSACSHEAAYRYLEARAVNARLGSVKPPILDHTGEMQDRSRGDLTHAGAS